MKSPSNHASYPHPSPVTGAGKEPGAQVEGDPQRVFTRQVRGPGTWEASRRPIVAAELPLFRHGELGLATCFIVVNIG